LKAELQNPAGEAEACTFGPDDNSENQSGRGKDSEKSREEEVRGKGLRKIPKSKDSGKSKSQI
jgi:hypothetical protein